MKQTRQQREESDERLNSQRESEEEERQNVASPARTSNASTGAQATRVRAGRDEQLGHEATHVVQQRHEPAPGVTTEETRLLTREQIEEAIRFNTALNLPEEMWAQVARGVNSSSCAIDETLVLAIAAYQSHHRAAPDGKLDAGIRASLLHDSESTAPQPGAAPTDPAGASV